MDDAAPLPVSTARYAKKRDAVMAAATEIINHRGVKGMTLADVAASVGLITTSVTYYFKKKEDLAAACFISGIARYDALISEALEEATPQARLHKFLSLYLDVKARIRLGEEPAIPAFNDVRALTDPNLSEVRAVYRDMFRKVRSLFKADGFRLAEPQDLQRPHAHDLGAAILGGGVVAPLRGGGLSAHPRPDVRYLGERPLRP